MNEASKLGGALAAVGVASRMIGEEKNQALEQGSKAHEANIKDAAEAKDLAETQIPDAEFEVERANDQVDIMNKAAEATLADPSATPDQKLKAAVDAQAALDDRTAAQKALGELNNKLTATKERMIRQEAAMKRGRRWGGAY